MQRYQGSYEEAWAGLTGFRKLWVQDFVLTSSRYVCVCVWGCMFVCVGAWILQLGWCGLLIFSCQYSGAVKLSDDAQLSKLFLALTLWGPQGQYPPGVSQWFTLPHWMVVCKGPFSCTAGQMRLYFTSLSSQEVLYGGTKWPSELLRFEVQTP